MSHLAPQLDQVFGIIGVGGRFRRSEDLDQEYDENFLHPGPEQPLKSKPLGYVSSDVADLDPVILNLLLIGWQDASFLLAVYANSQLIGKRCWCHSKNWLTTSEQALSDITSQTCNQDQAGTPTRTN